MLDNFGRKINYLRISVTDRCNLRCFYCMPEQGLVLKPHEEILRYEEILRLAGLFKELGIEKVRVTGGEPLIRKGVTGLVRELSKLGFMEVALTTNGIRLREFAAELYDAGLRRINISLDSFDPETYRHITGGDVQEVLKSLAAARSAGFDPIKINVVLMKGVNENQVSDFLALALKEPYHVRFIQFMPFHHVVCVKNRDLFLDKDRITELIRGDPLFALFDETDQASSGNCVTFARAQGSIGVIVPVGGRFCSECNRVRLTADGMIRPCLLGDGEIDIKTPLRLGAKDDELKAIMAKAIEYKPEGYPEDQTVFCRSRTMTQIGG